MLVNDNEHPSKLKIQVSNPLKGFIIADTFDEHTQEYGIKDLESVVLQPKTSPSMQLEKINNGTASEKDKNYGLSVVQNKPINKVIIKYRYFGFSFVETISVKQ